MMNKIHMPILVLLISIFLFSQAAALADSTVTVLCYVTFEKNPLSVSISAPSAVDVHKHFSVYVTVRNEGNYNLIDVIATIYLPYPPQKLKLMKGSKPTKKFGTLMPGETKSSSWTMKADQAGNYIIMVEASGIVETTGVIVSSQDTAVVSAI